MVLGLCLALVAAGSFIAFSLVARDASSPGLDVPVTAIAPVASAPALTFARPGDVVGGRDGVRRSTNGRDLVLGTRFFNGPITKAAGGTTSGGSACTTRCSGGGNSNPDTDTTPDAVPARPDPPSYEGKGKGSKGKPASAGPSPNGKAKGHLKAKGKGHNKHPGDH
jgi:hypothetical protein